MTNELPLVTEGVVGSSGHYVVPGTTTWREPPLPIMTPDGSIIGKVTHVWREGNHIKCTYELAHEGELESITVDTMNGKFSIDDDDSYKVTVEHPMIMGGRGWKDNRYIWRDDEPERA